MCICVRQTGQTVDSCLTLTRCAFSCVWSDCFHASRIALNRQCSCVYICTALERDAYFASDIFSHLCSSRTWRGVACKRRWCQQRWTLQIHCVQSRFSTESSLCKCWMHTGGWRMYTIHTQCVYMCFWTVNLVIWRWMHTRSQQRYTLRTRCVWIW